MRNRSLVLLGAAGIGAVLISGCGSSPSKSISAAGSSAVSSISPGDSSSVSALLRLEGIVLQAADLPRAAKGTPKAPDPNDAADQATMAKCVGVRNTDPAKVAEARSESYALGNTIISSVATSYRSQSDLDTRRVMLRSPKVSSCFHEKWRKQLASVLPAGATIESTSVKITPGSAGGPANVVATGAGAIMVRMSGQRVPVYASIIFISGPLTEVGVEVVNIGTPLAASEVKSLVAGVAQRAARA